MSYTYTTTTAREKKKSSRSDSYRMEDKKARNKNQMLKRKRTNGEKLTFAELEIISEYPLKVKEKQLSRLIKCL